MNRIKRKYLDIGTAQNQIGLGATENTEGRQLVSLSSPQAIQGQKTFLSPPRSRTMPLLDADAVPKKALLEKTLCTAYTVTDIFTINQTDLQNGYVTLSRNVAPGRLGSLEVVEFDGAHGVAFNADFGVITNPDGSVDKLQWQGWPLGQPGKMMLGQRMVVRYSACRESLYETMDPNRLFLPRVEGMTDTTNFVGGKVNRNNILTAADSGKNLELMRLATGEIITVRLPQITGNSGVGLTCAGGRLLLYTTPSVQLSVIGKESGKDMVLSQKPFVTGDFKVYEYNGATWDLKLTDSMLPEFEALGDVSLYSHEAYAPLVLEVLPVGKDKVGLYRAWRTARLTFLPGGGNNSVYGEDIELYADLKIFDMEYRYVTTKRVFVPIALHSFAFFSVCRATDDVFIPTSSGVRASGSHCWPVYGAYGDNGMPDWLVPLTEDLSIALDYGGDSLGLYTVYSPLDPNAGLVRTIWENTGGEGFESFIRGDLALLSSENHLGMFDMTTYAFKDLSGSDMMGRYRDAEAQHYRGLLVLDM